MGIFKDIWASLETARNKSDYKKAHKVAMQTSAFMHLIFQNFKSPEIFIKHPLHETRLIDFKHKIDKMEAHANACINLGDSLTDLSRAEIDSIDGIFSVSGMWHYHMAQMSKDLKPYLAEKNVLVKYVAVGCLGGNPMLVYQDLNSTVENSLKALNDIKADFPDVKFIVYGLPPAFNLNIVENSYNFDAQLINWCISNSGVFISLKNLGSTFGLFPKVEWSSDGVHFTQKAARRFSKAVEKAKSALPGSVIFA